MNVREEARLMKLQSPELAASSIEKRNKALDAIAKALVANKDKIFEANGMDLEAADKNGVSSAVQKRLKFNEDKLKDVIAGIEQLISLSDPLGKNLLHRELDAGLELYRVSCPIGVIGVIFEARPDALVQISCLCLKSGNCAILKGGKETANTNRVLFNIIHDTAVSSGLPEKCLVQVELHNEIDELLSCDKDVDLLIPRGSNAFVQYIMNNTKIPVMGHADGVCHTYVDADADIEKAIPILIDAKTQYTAACNATETVLVNRKLATEFLPKLAKAFSECNVKLHGTEEVQALLKNEVEDAADSDFIMEENDFHREYLDMVVSLKLVDSAEEAVNHINRFGSHHTDAIITENKEAAEYFMQMVDSAGVYQNCSTRFADGFRYGFGAEVGISTSKLHARGPVGLDGLVTYKYKLFGSGQIVNDYSTGVKEFHFRDIE